MNQLKRNKNHKPKWPKTPPTNGAIGAEDAHQVLSFIIPMSIRRKIRRMMRYLPKQVVVTRTLIDR